MEIKFRAKRAAFNEVIESRPNDMQELWMTDKHGHQYNCDPATLEIVIDGKAVKVTEIKKLMILKAQIGHLIKLVTSDRNDADVVRDIIKFMKDLEGKTND